VARHAERPQIVSVELERAVGRVAHRDDAGIASPERLRHLLILTGCYLGRVDRFVLPAAASIVVGLLLGAAAIFGVTLMVQQDTKPPLQAGDPGSSVLNRVEYGDRT
jgi:hypothetical protein